MKGLLPPGSYGDNSQDTWHRIARILKDPRALQSCETLGRRQLLNRSRV
jgi:hypothetical protein